MGSLILSAAVICSASNPCSSLELPIVAPWSSWTDVCRSNSSIFHTSLIYSYAFTKPLTLRGTVI